MLMRRRSRPLPDQASRVARLRMSSLGLVSMLIIQFILGIIYNLYGTAPTSAKSVGMFSSPVLALHVILFFLLVIAAVGQLIRALGARHRLTLWMSAIGVERKGREGRGRRGGRGRPEIDLAQPASVTRQERCLRQQALDAGFTAKADRSGGCARSAWRRLPPWGGYQLSPGSVAGRRG